LHRASCIGASPCVASSRRYCFFFPFLPHLVVASHPGIASRLVTWHTGTLAARRDRIASHRLKSHTGSTMSGHVASYPIASSHRIASRRMA
jgi:hypothetical protein